MEDPFIWMENLENPRVKSFISEMNLKFRREFRELSSKIIKELKKYYTIPLIGSVKFSNNGVVFSLRLLSERQIRLRWPDGEEEVLVSSKELGRDAVIHWFKPSREDNRLAFFFSYASSDEGILGVIDVETKELIDKLKGSLGDIVWLKDGYYYSRFYRKGKTPDGVKAPAERIFL